MKNVKVLKAYENAVIYRQFMIMILAGPIPAAIIKLQGTLLDETLLGAMMMVTNVFGLTSYWFAKNLDWKKIFVLCHVGCVVSLVGFTAGYLMGVDYVYLILVFPTSMGFFLMIGGIYSSQMKDIIKNEFKEDFDLGLFENKRKSANSAAGFLGQGAGVLFYMFFSVEAIKVYLALELLKGIVWLVAEYRVYVLVKELEK